MIEMPRRKRLVAAAFVGCCKLVGRTLAFLKWDIGVKETDPNEERHDAGDGFELTDFDVVVGSARPGGDKQFSNTIVRAGAHDPDPVIAWALLVRRLLAQDFGAIAALHEFAESSLRDHIWCFDFPVHGPAHAFSKDATLGIPT